MTGKEDATESQKITFTLLTILTSMITVLCVANAVRFYKNGRFKNMALFHFYLFSFLTFLGKLFTLCIPHPIFRIVRILFFLDVAFDYDWCTFQVLKGLPPYCFLTTAYCYMTNCA
jgi:hypothetical protein